MANKLNIEFFDTDKFYWEETEPPFQIARSISRRIELINSAINDLDSWVLSGSLSNWSTFIENRFTCAVFVKLDPKIRLERLIAREQQRYGARIQKGGDMYDSHLKFLEWAKSYDTANAPTRSLDLHEGWMSKLSCPVFTLNSSVTVGEMVEEVFRFLSDLS